MATKAKSDPPIIVTELSPEQLKVKVRVLGYKLGTGIDKMFELREEKRVLDAQVAAIEAELHAYEEALLEQMKSQGIDKATGSKATISRTMGTVAGMEDWDKLCAFIKRTGNFQLLQKRVSDPAYRELLESKGVVPGLQPFTKVRLNLRVLPPTA